MPPISYRQVVADRRLNLRAGRSPPEKPLSNKQTRLPGTNQGRPPGEKPAKCCRALGRGSRSKLKGPPSHRCSKDPRQHPAVLARWPPNSGHGRRRPITAGRGRRSRSRSHRRGKPARSTSRNGEPAPRFVPSSGPGTLPSKFALGQSARKPKGCGRWAGWRMVEQEVFAGAIASDLTGGSIR